MIHGVVISLPDFEYRISKTGGLCKMEPKAFIAADVDDEASGLEEGCLILVDEGDRLIQDLEGAVDQNVCIVDQLKQGPLPAVVLHRN